MDVTKLSSDLTVARAAADEVAHVLATNPAAVLLLPAGGTPVPLYRELVRRQHAGELDLGRARIFQLDEIVGVAPDAPESFHAFFRRHLFEPLGRNGDEGIHLLDGSAPDPAAEIRRHAQELRACGSADLVLLGLGLNGHVGFNEPGTRADDGARIVTLESTTIGAQDQDLVAQRAPELGMTLGLADILRGARIRVLVTGAKKRDILRRLLASPPTPALPASFLRAHADAGILADAEAAPSDTA